MGDTIQRHEVEAPGRTRTPERGPASPAGPPPDYGRPVRLLACGNCDTRLAIDAAAAAPGHCPLCGLPAQDEAAFAGAGPTRAAPFAVSPARAAAIYRRWLARLRCRPPEFLRLARARELHGLYLPLWTVDAVLRSRWTAEVATGPVGVAAAPAASSHRRWERVAGERVDHFVEACPAVPLTGEPRAVAPLHDADGLVPWAPEYLEGFGAVVPVGGPDEAWDRLRATLHERAQQGCAAEAPGLERRSLQVETTTEVADVSAALVPVYVAAVPWRGRIHRFLIDGRTGRGHGEAPYSVGRLAGLLGAGLLAAAATGAILAGDPPPARPAATQATQPAPAGPPTTTPHP